MRSTYSISGLVLILTVFFSACSTKKKPYWSKEASNWKSSILPDQDKIAHTLYLIGDTGELDNEEEGSNYTVDAMAGMINMTDKNASVVFLGDNVYPKGLSKDLDSPERKLGNKILDAQFNPLTKFAGEIYMIPGNHDWNKHKRGGLEAIQRQEEYVENNYPNKDKIHFYPNNGCGDPEVVKINKEVVYIFLDSQWWLQNWSKENRINQGCEIKSRGDLLKRMEELFLKYKNKEIICMLHHPIKSNGNHGGYFSLKQHIFPMAELGIWLPLPIIGSIYPIYRQATGSVQDNTNIHNQNLTKSLESMAKFLRINVVFASGHEHGLEYYESERIKYIVSGSGSKTSYIQSGGEAEYAREARGFARILFYRNFESWMEMYTVAEHDHKPRLEYRVQLRAPRAGTVEEDIKYPSLNQKDTIFAANEAFQTGGFKKFFLGEQYRDMWATPIKTELIDLETKHGGLTPIKKGGGMSSNSLRMQHHSGKQYILRSIRKDYRKLVPEGFGNLKLLNIMKDQNSASHPYGALAMPTLSRAANIYYTEPQLVFLKHQKGLGNYNSQFPEELYLLEERPSGNWSDDPKFGNAKDIISYADLLKNLRTKKNHKVDQHWVLKSRIFDLWVHDWDRHDDQWRWAKFKDGESTFYRPIPRDRDQVFYKFIGVVPSLVATFLQKKFKTMKHDVKDVANLSFNAKHFDRFFLNDLEWNEWQEIVRTLQNNLNDDVIEEAMSAIPEEVRHLDNAEIIAKLKSRRGKLEKISKKLYDFLSEEVEIIGSDNMDRFVIEYKINGSIRIQQFVERKKKENILKYDRTFYPNETQEVRIYGRRDNDHFELKGQGKSKIKVRIIGGEGMDEVLNSGLHSTPYIYDQPEGIQYSGKVKDRTSDDYLINEYNRNEFLYDTGLPILSFGRTRDDGWWFGAGYTWTNKGWRKKPYKSQNSLSFSVAPGGQNAFRFNFKSDNVDVFNNLDLTPEVTVNFPRYENYFGLGNESINPNREIPYNWVKMQTIDARLMLRSNLSNSNYILFGPQFQSQDIDLSEGRVASDPALGFNEDALERRNYVGFRTSHHFEYVDNKVFPSNGFLFNADVNYMRELTKKEDVTEFNVGASAYIRIFAKPKIVLANAVGYKRTWGDLQFHQFADLGNTTNLRGYRNNRFRGNSAFYHNVDIRTHIMDWDNTWLPMEIGILGGFDQGRVWLEEENSSSWHTSYTAGIWMNVLDLFVIQPHYSIVNEDEGNVFSLLLGFNF